MWAEFIGSRHKKNFFKVNVCVIFFVVIEMFQNLLFLLHRGLVLESALAVSICS